MDPAVGGHPAAVLGARRPAHAGEAAVDLEKLSARGGWGAATATVGGKPTCQARLFFVIAPREASATMAG